ncbi:nose resistant to fluoxetine protein 6 [Caerostris darwini]|uniref:Nose resistant to fluoxetine protein 6 n=1 Tax=Caerostris darwini TaxID=1538125 RepID=A0AAV4TS44_9ARAC|nr:nose resistant to fluoxetine protein 6 [Caerostris darwini]
MLFTVFQCLPHSWYIAVDFQLHLVALLVLQLILRWPKFGISLCGLFITLSSVFTAVVTYITHLYPAIHITRPDPTEKAYYWLYIYFQAYSHAGPYFIGFLAGYLLATTPDLKFSRYHNSLRNGNNKVKIIFNLHVGKSIQWISYEKWRMETSECRYESAFVPLYEAHHVERFHVYSRSSSFNLHVGKFIQWISYETCRMETSECLYERAFVPLYEAHHLERFHVYSRSSTFNLHVGKFIQWISYETWRMETSECFMREFSYPLYFQKHTTLNVSTYSRSSTVHLHVGKIYPVDFLRNVADGNLRMVL